MQMRRAVVIAGGGFAGSAWSLGLVAGLADSGVDLRDADLFIGTSSGSRTALHLACGANHEEAFQRRLQPGPPSTERGGAIGWPALLEQLVQAKSDGRSPSEILKRYGALALSAAAGQDASNRRPTITAQLPVRKWPSKKLMIVALSAERGERRAFDVASGIELVDAVIATTASFGWPPVLFEGEHYFDGGYYSTDNADLADGFDRVMILALKRPPEIPFLGIATLDDGVRFLEQNGSAVEVIQPDERALEAFAGAGGLMSPRISAPAAIAGRKQGKLIAGGVAMFWEGTGVK